MSQNNLQLNICKTGTFLNFWDSMRGDDVILRITPSQAYKTIEGEEIPVDLNEEMIKLAERICK